ncbi:MAG: acyltransferase family protein [Stagnimonas sp.]|nr:acyltransferase family protein [Stagnimonas sp.]
MIQHRPDIDGLRAVAVGLVLLFHVGAPVHGGFVGVDVFFVISGYLITSIIHGELAQGRFSLLRFYQRRARRILPALLAVLLATTLAAGWLLLPDAYRDFGGSLAATALFASNFYFWSQSDYFSTAAESLPLLHTWSLAIEEQFYLLLPLLLMALHRRGLAQLRWLIATLALGSLLLGEWQLRHSADDAFYLLPARSWELLLGSLLALDAFSKPGSRLLRELLGAGGLAMILYAGFGYSERTAFPGFAALLPCVGAALVIHSQGGGTTVAARLLSLRPVVFVGLISYSLYLWHWPLIVLYKQGLLGDFLKFQKLGLLAVSVILATLSWRYVERPFRRPPPPGSRASRQVLAAALVLGLAATTGGALLWLRGLPQRFPTEVLDIAAFERQRSLFRDGQCFLSQTSSAAALDRKHCLARAADRPNLLLLGDSHAAQYWIGLDDMLKTAQVQQTTASGCRPGLPLTGAERCTRMMAEVLRDFVPNTKPDAILLAARWKAWDVEPLVRLVRSLQPYSARIIVLGPVSEYRLPLPQVLALARLRQNPELPLRTLVREPFVVDALLAKRLAAEGIEYLSPISTLCPGGHCLQLAPNGDPLQFDYGHLTRSGSDWLVSRWLLEQRLRF